MFTDVTKRDVLMIESRSKDGAFVSGMFLEGARWDVAANLLEDSKPKDFDHRLLV